MVNFYNIKSIKKTIIYFIKKNNGNNTTILNVKNKTIIAEYMIITSFEFERQVKFLAKIIIKNLKTYGNVYVEGIDEGNWVIMNFQGIMVHIFKNEIRERYKIEKLWS